MPLFFTTPPLFPFTPATTPPPRTTDSTTPTYFTAIQSHLSATGQKAHQIALRNFGQPYATLADRISQTLWIVGVLLDRYPTAKVFVYTLLLTSLLPTTIFLCTLSTIFFGSIIVALSGIIFATGTFLTVGGFALSVCLFGCLVMSGFAAAGFTVWRIVAEVRKGIA